MSTVRRLTYVGVLIANLLLSGPLYADDEVASLPLTPVDPDMVGGLTVRAVGTEMGTYDSNPLLLTTGAKALWGSVTTPELIINDNTPTAHLGFDTTVVRNIFNQPDFDSTDFHEKFTASKKTYNWNAGLLGHVDYDTTRTSEVTDFNLRVAPVRHTGLDITPQIAFKPTALDTWALQGTAQQSTYANSVFTDYQTYSINPTYTHIFDPLNAGVFGFQAQRYQTIKGPRNSTDAAGPTIGWLGTLTPRLTANANVGVQEARQYSPNVPSQGWQSQFTFSGGLVFKGQQDVTNFTASRNQYPFGNGTEALLTTFGVTDVHALNALLSLNVGGNYQTADYQANATGNLESQWSGTGGLSYHLTDSFDITGTYQYRSETLVGVSQTADDHTILFGVVYHPEMWSL